MYRFVPLYRNGTLSTVFFSVQKMVEKSGHFRRTASSSASHEYTKRYCEFTRDMNSHKAQDSIHDTFYFAMTFLPRQRIKQRRLGNLHISKETKLV